jgi:cyclopropane-fatty-acyl-phospholipid synthase
MGIADSLLKHVPARFSLELLDHFFAHYPKPKFQVRLWDGTTWGKLENPCFVLVIKNPNALRQMYLSPSELSVGESYIYDDFDILGDIEAAVELGDDLFTQEHSKPSVTGKIANLFQDSMEHSDSSFVLPDTQPGELHSRERDRRAIRYHYDLPPEFFALWLDETKAYSCAYFENEDTDLETAQCRKLDYICRKLRLKKGEHLLDIGCGWGGLITYAAAHYGVHALGITLSLRQAEFARQRIRDLGLNDRCRVDLCDYRDLDIDTQFAKVASIGMFEHVGESHYAEYFSQVWRRLRPGGAFLNSAIAACATYQRQGPSFIDRYVFPDSDLKPIHTTLHAAELCKFEVWDVENLREHYALTLHHWVRRLEANADEARRMVGEITYRIWRLYMAASVHAFRSERLRLYHVLFVKPQNGSNHMPLTRADWYRHSLQNGPNGDGTNQWRA